MPRTLEQIGRHCDGLEYEYLTSSDTLENDIRVVLEQQQKGSPAKAQVCRRVVLSVHVMWTVIALEVA